ncbi:hypothetical protein V1478_010412, partial [Vespula squamosa]
MKSAFDRTRDLLERILMRLNETTRGGGGGGEERGSEGGGEEGRGESGLFRKAKAVYGRFDNGTELFMTPLRIISKNCPHKRHTMKRNRSFSIRNSRNSRLYGSISEPSVCLSYTHYFQNHKNSTFLVKEVRRCMDERKTLLSLAPKEASGRYVRLLREYRSDTARMLYSRFTAAGVITPTAATTIAMPLPRCFVVPERVKQLLLMETERDIFRSVRKSSTLNS